MSASNGAKVTICIPTYNRAAWLQQSISSVLSQTRRDFMLVVADNASSDETPHVVASYADPRLRYVRRPQNLGLVGNYDACLESITTPYAMFLPDDDLLHPDFLASTMSALEADPRVGMVHTAFDVIDDAGRVRGRAANWTGGLTGDTVESGMRFIRESMTWSCRVCFSTAVVRREAIRGIPPLDTDSGAFDFAMWLHVALDWHVAFLAAPLGRYRVHGTSETASLRAAAGTGYAQSMDSITDVRDLKLRFLEAHDGRLTDVEGLRRLVERARRREVVSLVRSSTVPDRRLLPTIRGFSGAGWRDLQLWREASAWRLLVGTIVGERAVGRLRRLRGRRR